MHDLQDIQHLFVGMDDERLADATIATALHLGPVLGAEVRVIHAMHPPGMTSLLREERESSRMLADALVRAREDRLEHLQGILEQLEDRDLRGSDLLSVRVGKPAEILLQLAESTGHSLIVLGPHRHRKLFDFGGTTREVLSAARCPVWVQPGEWSPIRRILAAVDLSKGSASIVAVAARLATLLSAELTIMHSFQVPLIAYDGLYPEEIINRERTGVEERFEEFLDTTVAPETRYSRQMLEGFPARAILGQQQSCDLIVMGSHGHSMFERVMLGSEAHRVLKDAERPVIVIPQRREVHLGAGTKGTIGSGGAGAASDAGGANAGGD